MATIPTSEFQVHKLIDLVRANRCLYEPLDVNHNNRAVINSVWRAISYEMCQPESVCREKWINLRSNYARELRKTRRKIHEMEIYPKRKSLSQWAHYEALSFLSPFVKTRLDTIEKEADNRVGIKLERLDSQEPDPLTLTEVAEEVSSSDNVANNEGLARWTSDLDDDRLFLLSLLPLMKRLHTLDNCRFRMEVQSLLLNKLQAQLQSLDPLATDAPDSV
uniref:MADF domain-containing protein n=2 Tax=Rhodnius prolixus TaxID=13249 RepID=T1HYJ9_RHOPR